MEGIIVNYQLGGKKSYPSRIIIQINNPNINVNSILGKKVEYKDKYGNLYIGKIIKKHGKSNDKFLVKFKPNLPGQALGSKVKILD